MGIHPRRDAGGELRYRLGLRDHEMAGEPVFASILAVY